MGNATWGKAGQLEFDPQNPKDGRGTNSLKVVIWRGGGGGPGTDALCGVARRPGTDAWVMLGGQAGLEFEASSLAAQTRGSKFWVFWADSATWGPILGTQIPLEISLHFELSGDRRTELGTGDKIGSPRRQAQGTMVEDQKDLLDQKALRNHGCFGGDLQDGDHGLGVGL